MFLHGIEMYLLHFMCMFIVFMILMHGKDKFLNSKKAHVKRNPKQKRHQVKKKLKGKEQVSEENKDSTC